MTTTFATRLVGDAGREIRLALVIQGIPLVFQQGRGTLVNGVVALAGYGDGTQHTRHLGLMKVEQASKELDMQQRRMIGGSLTAELLDDDAGTLQALFTPRKRRAAFLTADVTASSTPLLVTDVLTQIPDPVTVAFLYVGGETISYDGRTAPDTIDIASRGALGSEAAVHFGGTEQGEGIYLTPPSWIGRRVTLIGYFERDDGTTDAALAQVLDTFSLEEAPKYLGNGSWSLQCSHLSDEYAVRKVGVGVNDFKASTGVDAGNLFAKSTSLNRWLQGSVNTQALLESEDGRIDIFDITSATSLTATMDGLSGRTRPAIPGSVFLASGVGDRGRARHVAVLDGPGFSPGERVLHMLASKVGDAANGAYDVLGGYNRTRFGGFEFHFGAGINEGDLDVAAFVDVGGSGTWSNVIDGERAVSEVLFDFCVQNECFWYADSDGRLTVKRLAEDITAAPTSIGSSVIIGEPEVTYEEEAISPRVSLKCNYDPVSGDFEATVNVVDVDLAARYPARTDTLELESRSIVVEPVAIGDSGTLPRTATSLAGVEVTLRRIQFANGRGRALVRFPAHLDLLTLDLGEVVSLTAAVPNLEGGDVSGQSGRVVLLGPRIEEGEVDVVVELLDRAFVIAPACVIASRAGAVLTLQTTGPECASTSPGNMFAATNSVNVWDVSANVFETHDVNARTTTTITLATVPTFAHGTGDFVSAGQQDALQTAANTTGQVPLDFTYQMPDAPELGVTVDVETRWR